MLLVPPNSYRFRIPLPGDKDFIEADPLDEELRPPSPEEEDLDEDDTFRTIDRDEEIVRITHAIVEYRSLGPALVPWVKPPAAPQEKANVIITPRFGPKSAAG